MSFAAKLRNKVFEVSADTADAIDLRSYSSFLKTFPLQGSQLYRVLFDRHSATIQTQKARFATANLQKIFEATFEISATSGFDRMSLRDLSRATGMSMGAIYSCITKKEDIAVMVADIVRQSSGLTHQYAKQGESVLERIKQSIRFHLYASTLLQPWYFFLFFETRSLPEPQQTESKNIELGGIEAFESQINAGIETGELRCSDPKMVANTAVVLLEDWYLKPWKYRAIESHGRTGKSSVKQQEIELNNYYQSITKLVTNLLT
jgi:AcrR family transcriptional regulator